MEKGSWLLYGANGYSGVLIAEEAKRLGLQPILAGRREASIRPLAERLGMEWRVFPLDDPAALRQGIQAVHAVLLAAGPFSATSRPMLDACLAARTHYLDITGEIGVFEACFHRDADARDSECVVMPGVGMDVVPTDCLALALKEALPDATHLELGIASDGGPSGGTTRTMVEGLPHGSAVREDGKLQKRPAGWDPREIAFADRPRHCVAIPWGDLSTAFRTTGIPNISTHMTLPRTSAKLLRVANPLLPLMGMRPVQATLKAAVNRLVKGPDAATRAATKAQFWGRVSNASEQTVEGTLTTPEGYTLTAITAVECAERIAAGTVEHGTRTPAGAFGAGFISEFDGCEMRV